VNPELTAAPSDWLSVWIRLGDRCAEIQRLRDEEEASAQDVTFVYDSHDQATLA
jgi:hypothetical protein